MSGTCIRIAGATAVIVGAVAVAISASVPDGGQSAATGGDGVLDRLRRLGLADPPVGTVVAFAGDWPPTKDDGTSWLEDDLGWMLCDGRALDSSRYPELHRAVGAAHGGGVVLAGSASIDASDARFNLPDLRGLFLRGLDPDGTKDPEAADRKAPWSPELDARYAIVPPGARGNAGGRVGSVQWDALGAHAHTATVEDPGHTHSYLDHGQPASPNTFDADDERGVQDHGRETASSKTGIKVTVEPSGGKETRPRNSGVHWIIKTRALP